MNRRFSTTQTVGLVLLGCAAMAMPVVADEEIPLLRPEERQAVDAQSMQFSQAIRPALEDAAKSTVRIWYGRDRLAYGTVIGDGTLVLSKWSEINRGKDNLIVESLNDDVRQATIEKVYQDEDLAVLKIIGDPLTPVKWVEKPIRLGGFLATPQPDGKLAGFGVVSVLERNLRETDQAFLGVVGTVGFDGKGVKIREVTEASGAANAGLKAGDVILQVGERKISGLLELQNSLVDTEPGDSLQLLVQRGENSREVEVILGNRPELPSFQGQRLQQMERMGTRLNRIRDSFSNAIQTDMALEPNQVGGPVVDLKGDVIGITVARADRTRSFVVPSRTIRELLQTDGKDPAVAELPGRKKSVQTTRVSRPDPSHPAQPPSPQRMQRHLDEMKLLLEFMQDEMDTLQRDR